MSSQQYYYCSLSYVKNWKGYFPDNYKYTEFYTTKKKLFPNKVRISYPMSKHRNCPNFCPSAMVVEWFKSSRHEHFNRTVACWLPEGGTSNVLNRFIFLLISGVKSLKKIWMNKKGWQWLKKSVSTSFRVRAAPKSWSKCTTYVYICHGKGL